jgi:hypothetical protein
MIILLKDLMKYKYKKKYNIKGQILIYQRKYMKKEIQKLKSK